MVANKKPSGRAISVPAGIAAGSCSALVISLVGVLITAVLVNAETIVIDMMGWGIAFSLLLGTISGCALACATVKRLRMQVSLLTALTYFLVLLGGNALFFDGIYFGIGVSALVVGIGAIVAGFAGISGGKGVKSRARKRPYR